MTANLSLEDRLSAVENAIITMQEQISKPQSINWLQQITGSFENELAFEEILAYGQAIRQGSKNGYADCRYSRISHKLN